MGEDVEARRIIEENALDVKNLMNGHDLMMILSETISLIDFLQKRVRLLAEEGCVCVPFSELL